MTSTIDLHIHSSFSDGSETPEKIVELIAEKQITTFSLTDHDTVAGIDAIERELFRRGLYGSVNFVPGVELSAIYGDLKCHILGYNFNPNAVPIRSVLDTAAQLRWSRLERRLKALEEMHGITLTTEERSWLYSQPTPGRPHIAEILIRRGLASSISDGILRYLKGAKVGITRQDAAYCISGIRNSGGVPVWAHPLGGEGEKRLTPETFEDGLKVLVGLGIQGLECYYSRYTLEESAYLVSMAEKYGLWVSGGSDYHGTRKNIDLGTLNADQQQVSSEQLTILPNLLSRNMRSLVFSSLF